MSADEDLFDDPEVLATLVSTLRGVAPSPTIRARLLAAFAEPRSRPDGAFGRFVEPFARLFEVSLEKARALLDATASDDAFERDPSGIALMHFAAGPRLARADTGIVRFPAGMEWPLHRHVGAEHHLFFEGGIRVHQDGKVYGPGDLLSMPAGSEHSFSVLPDRDCLTAVIIEEGGIELPPGTKIGF